MNDLNNKVAIIMGSSRSIGRAIALCTDDARWISGQNIRVNSGLT